MTRQNLIEPAGVCCRCEQLVTERLTVAIVEGNSGPGWSKYACLPCARVYARSVFAPQWLRDNVAALEAAHGDHHRGADME